MNISIIKKNNNPYIQINESIHNKEILEILLNVDIYNDINIVNKILEEITFIENYNSDDINKIIFSHGWNICRVNIYMTNVIVFDVLTDDNDAFCQISIHQFKQIMEFYKQNINTIKNL